MESTQIEAAPPRKPKPNTATSTLTTIGELLALKPGQTIEAAEQRLQQVSMARLAQMLTEARAGHKRIATWLINAEYTRRGIPPVFRPLTIDRSDRTMLMDSLAFDLEWIATKHPKHKPFFKRWQPFMRQPRFHATIRYILSNSRGVMYRLLKGLALTSEQQVECHYLRQKHITDRHHALARAKHETEATLMGKLMDRRFRASGKSKIDCTEMNQLKNIAKRWADIWLCAKLARGSQTRTAFLCNAYRNASTSDQDTKEITRQLADKLMKQLNRDLGKQSWKA